MANDKLYKTTNSTKRQTLQRGKLYKTTNSTKRQTQRQSAANARSQVELEREGETTSGAEGGRGKTVGRSAKVEWRVKSSLSSSIPPPAPTPPAPRVHFTIARLFETVEPEPKILVKVCQNSKQKEEWREILTLLLNSPTSPSWLPGLH